MPCRAPLVIDDNGTGWAVAATVLEVLPDLIKIDRSLIAHVDLPGERPSFLRPFRTWTREFGIGLVAEGVETAAGAGHGSRSRARLRSGLLHRASRTRPPAPIGDPRGSGTRRGTPGRDPGPVLDFSVRTVQDSLSRQPMGWKVAAIPSSMRAARRRVTSGRGVLSSTAFRPNG